MGFFGSQAIQPVPTPAPAPTIEDPEVKAAKEAERLALKRRQGRAGTILTGGQGATGNPLLKTGTLLGGGG